MHCLITDALAVQWLLWVRGLVRSWPRKLLLHFLSLARLLPTAHSTSCPTLYYTTDVEREARTLRSLRETNRAYVVALVVQVAEDGRQPQLGMS